MSTTCQTIEDLIHSVNPLSSDSLDNFLISIRGDLLDKNSELEESATIKFSACSCFCHYYTRLTYGYALLSSCSIKSSMSCVHGLNLSKGYMIEYIVEAIQFL